jgi:hypothetical protein
MPISTNIGNNVKKIYKPQEIIENTQTCVHNILQYGYPESKRNCIK